MVINSAKSSVQGVEGGGGSEEGRWGEGEGGGKVEEGEGGWGSVAVT